jgi:tetratricopeptide (TPR) repeat protein
MFDDELANHYAFLGSIYDFIGDYKKSSHSFRNSLNIHRRNGNKSGEANVLRKSSMVFWGEEAIKLMRKGLSIFEELKDLRGIAATLSNIAAESYYTNDDVNAKKYLEQSISIFQQWNSFEISYPLNNLGIFWQKDGRIEKSIELFTNIKNRHFALFDKI